MKSMTADLNTLLHKIMRAAKQKVKTTREHSIAAGPFFMKMLDKLPFIATVRTYKKEYFSPDFSAGLAEVRRAREIVPSALIFQQSGVKRL